jgi:tetratricopeptide (TPR) repeat protein
MASRTIFISHTQTDKELVDTLGRFVKEVFENEITAQYSSAKHEGSGIKPGESWLQWIVEQVQTCDVTVVVLTPGSIHKPWPMWEAGAVSGANESKRMAQPNATTRPIVPLRFGVASAEIPGPLGGLQAIAGDDPEDMTKFAYEVLFPLVQVPGPRSAQMGARVAPALAKYLSDVKKALLMLPLVPNEATVGEWLERLEQLRADGRASEAHILNRWIDVAFGARTEGTSATPIDVRIHRRLGQLYLDGKQFDRAAEQFQLARQLAPRDLFILRGLGEALTKKRDFDKANEVMEFVRRLDPNAFTSNADFAGLKGRWNKMQGNLPAARDCYRTALAADPSSFYMADTLGQVNLELGDVAGAKEAYTHARSVIVKLAKRNAWAQATLATAAIVLGDDPVPFLNDLHRMSPNANELTSIEEGLANVSEKLGRGVDVARWKQVIRNGN